MAKNRTQKGRPGRSTVLRELAAVDRLFAELEKSKTLPTFAEFFIACLMLDKGECANLRKMFPWLYAKVMRHIEKYRMA
jgi:hypothetical protein